MNPCEDNVIRYVRFQANGKESYGIVENDKIRRITAEPFANWEKTETTYPLEQVKLLVPTKPSKVLALAGNYKSHIAGQPLPENPEVFFKVPSCLIAHEEKVIIPPGTTRVDYEAEMVIVIAKQAKEILEADALKYVLGVTCGTDVSARDWQKNDKQWWRAKGSDTFGPCGPFIVSGLNYDNLGLQLRLNGQVKQNANTNELIFNVSQIVSFISRHITLEPGDLIYTGTPGKTSPIKPADVIEVELKGVGILRNTVAAER